MDEADAVALVPVNPAATLSLTETTRSARADREARQTKPMVVAVGEEERSVHIFLVVRIAGTSNRRMGVLILNRAEVVMHLIAPNTWRES